MDIKGDTIFVISICFQKDYQVKQAHKGSVELSSLVRCDIFYYIDYFFCIFFCIIQLSVFGKSLAKRVFLCTAASNGPNPILANFESVQKNLLASIHSCVNHIIFLHLFVPSCSHPAFLTWFEKGLVKPSDLFDSGVFLLGSHSPLMLRSADEKFMFYVLEQLPTKNRDHLYLCTYI